MATSPHITSPSIDTVACTHCGLTVPAGLVRADATEQFCCNGCQTVYQVIHSCGLERFYGLRDAAGESGQQAKTTARAYAEFDDEAFRALYCRDVAEGQRSVELYLEGVHCSACVWLVEKLPRILDGVSSARLTYGRSLVEVTWDPEKVKLSQVAHALDRLGYPAHPAKDARARQARQKEDHRFLIRIGVAAACAGNVMTIAFALYGGMFTGMEADYARFFRWISLGLGLIALLWPGRIFFTGAWAALRTRTAHLDLPIAIALSVGTFAGLINVIRDQGDIYFDSLTMLIFLLLVGRWIQRSQQRRAADAVELLYALTPSSVRVVRDGQCVDLPIEAVEVGELAEIRADESIAVDGVIERGESSVNQSLLTGEAMPVQMRPGDTVAAGTINCSAPLRIRITATGHKTRVGQLMNLVEQGAKQRSRIVVMADRLAGWFVVVLLLLASLTFLSWLWIDAARAAEHTVALLIVACPCALGLATPLTVSVALGQAAKRGVLIKGGDVFEGLARPGTLLLDKTGTLTQGKAALTTWHGSESVKPLVAALEAEATHPLAQAFVQALSNESSSAPRPTQVHHTPGSGISGSFEGQTLHVGSPSYCQQNNVTVSPNFTRLTEALIAQGQTPVHISRDGTCVAVAGFSDPLRSDAQDVIAELQSGGWDLHILSGDHDSVVKHVGQQLGLPPDRCHGHMSPEDKLDAVRTRSGEGNVVMVGDGVNDAAALAAATVGLAVHSSAEASMSAADAYLSRPGLRPLMELISASRRTLRSTRRGLGASLGYNAIAASMAIMGLLGPLTAAILMPISSITVLSIALQTRAFRS